MIRRVDDIISLQNFTNRIGFNNNYLVQVTSGTVNHYTDLNALINIISEDDLWLTNSRFSNDENEIKHGYKIAHDVIKDRLSSANDPLLKGFYENVDAFLDDSPQGVYICCFSEKSNSLSQWRSYGENGTGVSIGFDANRFQWITGSDLPPDEFGLMRLWEVYYDDDKKREIINLALDIVPTLHTGEHEEFIAKQTADAIHFFIPTFKNKDFADEDERRLIFTPSKKLIVQPFFKSRKQMLVPHFSLNSLVKAAIPGGWGKLPINTITVGPGARKEINKESIEMLLRTYEYQNVKVVVSDTPYRG